MVCCEKISTEVELYRSNYPVAFFAYMIETISYGNINGEIEEADTEGSR